MMSTDHDHCQRVYRQQTTSIIFSFATKVLEYNIEISLYFDRIWSSHHYLVPSLLCIYCIGELPKVIHKTHVIGGHWKINDNDGNSTSYCRQSL